MRHAQVVLLRALTTSSKLVMLPAWLIDKSYTPFCNPFLLLLCLNQLPCYAKCMKLQALSHLSQMGTGP